MSTLRALAMQGQSPWLDYIEREFVTSGELARLVAAGEVRGLTSNPAIFAKAMAGSAAYRAALERFPSRDTEACYEALASADVRAAAAVLLPLYERSGGDDGYVSLEVAPALAHETAATVAAARRLWTDVAAPNLMIKVPGTPAGIAAVPALIAAGINVNVTLLFSRTAYRQVAAAWMTGLEQRLADGLPLGTVASVASFFVSRIDTRVDGWLAAHAASTPAHAATCAALAGHAAIANARLAYRDFQHLTASPRWRALAARGALPQRLLWASTSTKSPHYRDVVYVEELIGPATVNTLPPATLAAFREHGQVRPSLTEDLAGAQRVMDELATLGLDLEAHTTALLDEGIVLFSAAYDAVLDTVRGALTR